MIFLSLKISRVVIFSRWRFPKREFHLIRRRTSVVHLRADIPEDLHGHGTFFAVRKIAQRDDIRVFFHIPFSFKVIKITAVPH